MAVEKHPNIWISFFGNDRADGLDRTHRDTHEICVEGAQHYSPEESVTFWETTYGVTPSLTVEYVYVRENLFRPTGRFHER